MCNADVSSPIRIPGDAGFEVGWMYEGHPTSEDKVNALEEMLSRHGDRPTDWFAEPCIVFDHVDMVEMTDFGRGKYVARPCRWGVYGMLREKPSVGYLRAKARMPLYGDREYDRIPMAYVTPVI